MFYHKLTDQFKRQSEEAGPFPRNAIRPGANAASPGGSARLGVAFALGAALFGGLLVTANVNMSAEAPQATAAAAPPMQAPPATVAAAPPTAPAPAPIVARAPEVKPNAPLDMAATGAIGEEPVKKLHPDAKAPDVKPKAKKKPAAHNP